MNSTHLYIGDDIVDLKPGQVVAISVKNIDIGELKSRFVSHTNNLKGIWSENNLAIFGRSNNEHSTSEKPYQLNQGKVVQNGIETIPNASLILKNTDNEEFSISIYENFYDFFSVIDGLTLKDINAISDSAWTASAIDSARTNTSGIVTVVLNWGKSGAIYQTDYFLPCFYYHSIVTSILEYTGLELSGDILTDPRFTDLVIPFAKDEFLYPEEFVNPLKAKATNTLTQNVNNLTTGVQTPVTLDNVVYGDASLFTASQRYNFSFPCNATVNASTLVTVSAYNDGTAVTVSIRKNSTTLLVSGTVTGASETENLSVTADFTTGDYVDICVETNAPIVGITFALDSSSLEIFPNRTVNRSHVFWNQLMPDDISCTEIIRDFFTRFGVLYKKNSNTLILKTLESICTSRGTSVNWSGKIVDRHKDEIVFDLDYAQNNYFNYTDAESAGLGRGNIEIVNNTLKDNKVIFTTPFKNSVTGYVGGYIVATIPVYDSTSTGIDTFSEEPGLRLLTLKSRTNETAITFNAISRTDYKLGYFLDLAQSKDTGFEYFLSQFYPSLETALQNNKILVRYFNLNEIDVASYDPLKLVYYGEGYGIVNKISNFIPGKITKVEIFKVS